MGQLYTVLTVLGVCAFALALAYEEKIRDWVRKLRKRS